MQTILYSLGYLVLLAGLGVVFVGQGFFFLPRLRVESLPELVWGLLVRYGLGLAVLSGVVVWLGLAGGIRVWTVWPVALLLATAGAFRGWRGTRIDRGAIRARMREEWGGLSRWERRFGWAAGFWLVLLFVNFVIGGLVPDISMDSMWYHLTVPGQWVITGYTDTFPYCMPSSYPLGMESLYAAVLLFSDVVLCVSLSAQVIVALYTGIVVLTWRWAGLRAALMVGGIGVPLFAAVNCVAPLGAMNDDTMALLLLLPFGILLNPLRMSCESGVDISPGRLLASGFLLGSALAVKLVALPFGAVVGCGFVLVYAWRRTGWLRLSVRVAIVVVGAILAYLPWAIRGVLGSGNPVFPLLADWFPVREEYRLSLDLSRNFNSLFPLTLEGLRESVMEGLPNKLHILFNTLDAVFWLLLIAVTGVALWRDDLFWTLQAGLVFLFYGAFVLMKGHNEVGRYFALCYPMGLPLVGRFLDRLLGRIRPVARYGLLALLMSAGVITFARKQVAVANYSTIQWKFSPVVTPDARRDYADRAEAGRHYLAFESLQDVLEPDAYVFMPQTWYVYYVKRRALWDLREDWKKLSADQAVEYVRDGGFDYCIFERESDTLAQAVLTSGLGERIDWSCPAAPGWAVYKLKARHLSATQAPEE